MPLVVITGIPASGKTTRAMQLKDYLEKELKKTVHIVSENEVITSSNINKNALYLDSSKEKEIRSIIKSKVQRQELKLFFLNPPYRLVGPDTVVIMDAANYIKGYRYEVYCMSKSSKTTQCTLHCETSPTVAWEFNTSRETLNCSGDEKYSKEIFDALVMRYEAPDNRNRWDSPLIVVQAEDTLPAEKLSCALFDRKPPPPNLSTQNAPLSATNYLHELDRITQEIVTAILSAQNTGLEGDVKIPGHSNLTVKLNGNKLTAAQLGRHKRQFLTYSKMHPSSDTSQVASLFVQYLNTSIPS
ncbi:Protein KTI12-like protein [Frankliniella fusca]|uniref:Protein KTI12 homolog n=1 Tax=Frankliniella fusca TaxID=407009 RepID=A0AAE1HZ29_9NEOP|nr:Protein KTI12-like protein [Frankliniella fusca]